VGEDVQAGYGQMGAPGGYWPSDVWRVQTSVQPEHEGSTLGWVLRAAGGGAEDTFSEQTVLAEWDRFVTDVVAGRRGPEAGTRLGQPVRVRLGGAEFELFECSRMGE
jgi:hypothetical protein